MRAMCSEPVIVRSAVVLKQCCLKLLRHPFNLPDFLPRLPQGTTAFVDVDRASRGWTLHVYEVDRLSPAYDDFIYETLGVLTE